MHYTLYRMFLKLTKMYQYVHKHFKSKKQHKMVRDGTLKLRNKVIYVRKINSFQNKFL